MLLIQAPGSLLTVYYQLFRAKRGPSTWLPYLLAGIQQIILIFICLWLRCRKPPPPTYEEVTITPETTGLLGTEPKVTSSPSLNSTYGSLSNFASESDAITY